MKLAITLHNNINLTKKKVGSEENKEAVKKYKISYFNIKGDL